jgi:hypothetical protein
MIELDELLNDEAEWEQVVDFFENGEFYEEHYLIDAIEKHLQTEEQRKRIFDAHTSIEKMLNGRCEAEQIKVRDEIFSEWNKKLGFEYFSV